MKNAGLYFLFSLLFLCTRSQAQEEMPFWQNNQKIFQQMLHNRKIVVRAQVKRAAEKTMIKVTGAGIVNVPMAYATSEIIKFENLTKVSSSFEKVVHRPEIKEVYIFIKALGMQVRFIQSYKWNASRQKEPQLDWIVTWGPLKGMVGHYRFRKISPRKTEVSIWTSLGEPQWPIPRFLLGFTLEVIAEKTAQKMRNFLESNYRNSKKVSAVNVRKHKG